MPALCAGWMVSCSSFKQCTFILISWMCICMSHFVDAPGLSLLRLSHGSYGRLEVYYSGSWGTVCDDSWSTTEGNVTCRELGYGQATSAPSNAAYGEGSGPIWMDNVVCGGSERRLSSCSFNGWGIHDCGHREDAGVVCSLEGKICTS